MLESEKGQDTYFYLSLTWVGQSASECGGWSEGRGNKAGVGRETVMRGDTFLRGEG